MPESTMSTMKKPLTNAWQTLSRLLPPRNEDCDYWWDLTGRHLAAMVDAAGYSMDKQYEALLFHYYMMVPYMGCKPSFSSKKLFQWPSELTLEGLPLEYSWKWDIGTKKPVIRYTIEAKDEFTGTMIDPLNQKSSCELLHRLRSKFPDVDLSWTNSLLTSLYDHDRSEYAKRAETKEQYTTSVMIAAELNPEGLTSKTYLIPRWLKTNANALTPWKNAISRICPSSAARDALYNFLDSPAGSSLSPTMLAVDNVKPELSRLKFYLQSPHSSFSAIRQIMTLDGKIPIPEKRIQELRSLVIAVTGVEEDYPIDMDLPVAHEFNPPVDDASDQKTLVLQGCGYYFDIAPGRDFPEVKIFIRLCVFGPDDRTIGRNLADWMESHGRGDHSSQYLAMTETLVEQQRLDEGKGVTTHVSALFKPNGELDITSYLSPKVSTQAPMSRQRNGHTNGYTNGHTNGYTNGHANGHTNGHANGYTNGYANGYTNGHANGHSNGHTNGNGYANGI